MLIKTSSRALLACIAIFYTFISAIANAQTKPNLVLLPIEIDQSLSRLESDFGAALEEGLQQRYTVFYGAEVEKLLEKEYAKIDCTAESCNQALAVAFNGELIADASVKSVGSGYLLKLRITNVLTNQVVRTSSYPCKSCDEFDVISQLKALGADNIALATAPVQKSRVKIKSAKPKEISADDRAILIFDSKPSGAELFINDEKVGTTPYQGLNHYIGEQLNIKLVAQYHKPLEQTVELVKPINQLEAFSLEAGTAFIQVAGEEYAENTKVFIDGEEKGIAPLNIEVPAGQHTIYLKTPYTTSSEKTITLDDGAQQQIIIPWGIGSVKNTPLENLEEQAILIFDTQPSGAEVFINGQSVGKTPYQDLNHKKKDKLEVSIKEPNHRTIEFDVELLEPITKLDDFVLEKGQAKITVLTEPFKPNMEVYVNGEAKGIAPLSIELDAGSYTIEAKSDQQNSKTKTIQLNDGDNQQVLLSFSSSSITPKKASKPVSTTLSRSERASLDTVQSIIDSLVDIPAGSFMMGSDNGYYNEKPVHNVTVPAFKVMKHEVTQGQWKAVMGSNPVHYSGCGSSCPVARVSWKDIQIFILKLNQKASSNFRLPSEAEWEYAARAGSTTKYSWGDSIDCSKAQYGFSTYCDNQKSPYPVGAYQSNDFGLYDMHGNVWEWAQDCWNGSYDSGWFSNTPDDGSAWDSGDCGKRVIRGGSWNNGPYVLRSANRRWNDTAARNNNVGFRLAHD